MRVIYYATVDSVNSSCSLTYKVHSTNSYNKTTKAIIVNANITTKSFSKCHKPICRTVMYVCLFKRMIAFVEKGGSYLTVNC